MTELYRSWADTDYTKDFWKANTVVQIDLFEGPSDIDVTEETPWPTKPTRAKLWKEDWIDLTERNAHLRDDFMDFVSGGSWAGLITEIVNSAGCSLQSMCSYMDMDRHHLLRIDSGGVTKIRESYPEKLCDFSIERITNKRLSKMIGVNNV